MAMAAPPARPDVGLIAAPGLPTDLVAGLETDDAVKEAVYSYRASDNS
jgi:hypothetical protein